MKFFLHIDMDEQKERLQARLDEPTKRWKFRLKKIRTVLWSSDPAPGIRELHSQEYQT